MSAMNGESANRFISALVKSLQTLCHGYVDFNDGIEIIGHLYLNIDSGPSFDYIVKEKVCKNADSGTLFVSKSFQAHSPPGEVISRHDDSNRIQSAISSMSNVFPGQPTQKAHHPNPGKRKKDHTGNYNLQPTYTHNSLQPSSSSSSSAHFNMSASSSKQANRAQSDSEHLNNFSHSEFFGGADNHGSGVGMDEEDDLALDVTFVKDEYQRNSSDQRRVSARLSQGSNHSNMQMNYPPNHNQAPQQFATGSGGDMDQGFQDPSQMDIGQQSGQGPPNPRNSSGHPQFRVPAVPSVKMFRCPVCGIAIRHKNNIKRHMKRHNDPATQGNGSIAEDSKNWAQHFVPVTEGNDGRKVGRTYNCPICGLVISHRKNIRRHMRKHTGEMFFCDMCDWRGTCRWKMQKHRERKHNVPSLLPDESEAGSLVEQPSPLSQSNSPSMTQHSSPGLTQHSSPGLVQHNSPGIPQHGSPAVGQSQLSSTLAQQQFQQQSQQDFKFVMQHK